MSSIVCSILMLGLPNSINYFLSKAETPQERDRFLSVYYTLNTALSLGVGIILITAIPLLKIIFKNELISCFWYFLAFFPLTKIIMSSIDNFLVVCNKTNDLMKFRIANSAAVLGVILLVGKNCWIGTRCLILPGVTINEGAVVAAGSVVTKDVPEMAIVAGNPARIVKYRDANVYQELSNYKKQIIRVFDSYKRIHLKRSFKQ